MITVAGWGCCIGRETSGGSSRQAARPTERAEAFGGPHGVAPLSLCPFVPTPGRGTLGQRDKKSAGKVRITGTISISDSIVISLLSCRCCPSVPVSQGRLKLGHSDKPVVDFI
jgi:hypothetical protein